MQTKLLPFEGLTRGRRIFHLRKLLKLTRLEFSKKHGISRANLQNWENDRYHDLKQSILEKLIEAFEKEGIRVSKEWLMTGKDKPPLFSKSIKSQFIQEEPESYTDAERIEQNASYRKLYKALCEAVEEGRLSEVKHYLQLDLDLKEAYCSLPFSGKAEQSALHLAVLKGYGEIVQWLVESGVALNVRNSQQQTPLHLAVYTERLYILRYLLDKEADLSAFDLNGHTPLAYAAYLGRVESFQALLTAGSPILSKDKLENSLVHLAAEQGQVDILKLLSYLPQVDFEQKNALGHSPLECAIEAGEKEAAEFLIWHIESHALRKLKR